MDVRDLSKLSTSFVHSLPEGPQTVSGGKVDESWKAWQFSMSAWLDQAQSVVDLTETMSATRAGSTMTVTGSMKAGERIDGVFPARSFMHGDVRFDENGFIQNGGGDVSLSVTFAVRR